MIDKLFRNTSDPAFDREFAREILLGERQRVTILAIALATSLVINFVMFFFFQGVLKSISLEPRILWWVEFVLIGAIAYECIARMALSRFIGLKREPPLLARYVNAFIETSFPTVVLLILAHYEGPAIALQSNITLFYALFIILSTLRLKFSLCFWTGLIAAVEYLGIWLYSTRIDSSLLNPAFITIIARASVGFIVLGTVAGAVSLQIRERVSRSLRTLEERNRIINVFGQHVSPAVVDKLLDRQATDTEIRYVCMMFLDIRNFTTFSEHSNPTAVIDYLNKLFDSCIEIINRHHGIINKFLGDGFMAVFGAPISHERECENAVAAAREILDHVEQLVRTGGIPPTKIGIGLHAGEAITGTVGSTLRKEYTVIGDVVNVAARIEQLNKQLSSQLLISEAVWNALGENHPRAEAIERQILKGRAEAVQLWKLA